MVRSLAPRPTGCADFPHPAFPETFASVLRKQRSAHRRQHQAQVEQVLIGTGFFRRADGPLALAAPVPHHTLRRMPTELPERARRMTQSNVRRPASHEVLTSPITPTSGWMS